MDTAQTINRTAFLLAMLDMDGVGRAAASRLFLSFTSFEDIARYPDEQITTRLKRIPKASFIAKQLRDSNLVEPLLADKISLVTSLSAKAIHIITPDHELWPIDYNKYAVSGRPPYLFLFGNEQLLTRRLISFHQPSKVDPDSVSSFVVKKIAESGVPIILQENDASSLENVSLENLVLVLESGLEALSENTRGLAKEIVKAGGLLVSPFDMKHEHYSHDLPYLNATTNGLARVIVYSNVPFEHPLFDDMLRLTEHDKPIFAVSMQDELPDGVHPVRSEIDAEWIFASLGSSD